MPYWGQTNLRWSWYYFTGEYTARSWNDYVDAVRGFFDACARGAIILHVLHDAQSPDAAQREQLATVMRAHPRLDHAVASAIAVDSLLARGALMAVNWISKKPFEEKAVATPREGIAWLRERARPHVVDELVRDLLATIPPADAWSKLTDLRADLPEQAPPQR